MNGYFNFKEKCYKVGLNLTKLVSTDGALAVMVKNKGDSLHI